MTRHDAREDQSPQPSTGDPPKHRFYAHALPKPNADHRLPLEITLDPEESRHARRALRLQPGDRIELIDGSGTLATATLTDTSQHEVTARIDKVIDVQKSAPSICIASAVPKGPRVEAMIDQLVQVGADSWTPLTTEHAVVQPTAKPRPRHERRALAALKQSRRTHALAIHAPATTADLCHWTQPLRLLADTTDAEPGPTSADLTRMADIAVAIGPEAGWSDRERQQLIDAGWQPWSLGPHVMRIETAAPAAAAILRYLSG
ncbi:RsmE family RNA methyltransferase [Mucisphaera sp.]|uniref:RsmE family RNA methyltransferase n=1 Tax=Mucisphaera sp. TaxID=2913024 RepID=UPI003D1044A4